VLFLLFHHSLYFSQTKLKCSSVKALTCIVQFVLECNILFILQSQHMLYVPTIASYTQVLCVPNVVGAHAKERTEHIHLASGHTLCNVQDAYQ
jgi:hypothetical protein